MSTWDPLVGFLFRIREGLLCFVFLIGISAGIFAIVHRRALAGWLTITGFALLGVEPLVRLLGRWAINHYPGNQTLIYINQANLCLGTPALALGALVLILAILSALETKEVR